MSGIWGWVAGALGGLVVVVVGDLVSEEVRVRLDRIPQALIGLAARRVAEDIRANRTEEWDGELYELLQQRRAAALPISRLVLGVNYALGILRSAGKVNDALSRYPRYTLNWILNRGLDGVEGFADSPENAVRVGAGVPALISAFALGRWVGGTGLVGLVVSSAVSLVAAFYVAAAFGSMVETLVDGCGMGQAALVMAGGTSMITLVVGGVLGAQRGGGPGLAVGAAGGLSIGLLLGAVVGASAVGGGVVGRITFVLTIIIGLTALAVGSVVGLHRAGSTGLILGGGIGLVAGIVTALVAGIYLRDLVETFIADGWRLCVLLGFVILGSVLGGVLGNHVGGTVGVILGVVAGVIAGVVASMIHAVAAYHRLRAELYDYVARNHLAG